MFGLARAETSWAAFSCRAGTYFAINLKPSWLSIGGYAGFVQIRYVNVNEEHTR